jgi:hypothetical protein
VIQSEEINELTTALIKFHVLVGKVAKSETNPFFKSKYASLSTILQAIDQPLIDCGLAVSQWPDGEHELATQVSHSSGQWMRSTYKMRPATTWDKKQNEWREQSDPQGDGSRITYQRRYALGAALSLNIDDDDDGNAATRPRRENVQVPPKSVQTFPSQKGKKWQDVQLHNGPSAGTALVDLSEDQMSILCGRWLDSADLKNAENLILANALESYLKEIADAAAVIAPF